MSGKWNFRQKLQSIRAETGSFPSEFAVDIAGCVCYNRKKWREAANGSSPECRIEEPCLETEWNDIYDADRNLTGRVHMRGTPWKPGEFGLVVCVWVYDGRGRPAVRQSAGSCSRKPGSGQSRRNLNCCARIGIKIRFMTFTVCTARSGSGIRCCSPGKPTGSCGQHLERFTG